MPSQNPITVTNWCPRYAHSKAMQAWIEGLPFEDSSVGVAQPQKLRRVLFEP
jgi:hypothetical protein